MLFLQDGFTEKKRRQLRMKKGRAVAPLDPEGGPTTTTMETTFALRPKHEGELAAAAASAPAPAPATAPEAKWKSGWKKGEDLKTVEVIGGEEEGEDEDDDEDEDVEMDLGSEDGGEDHLGGGEEGGAGCGEAVKV
jgi:hypothetical protein